MSDLRCDAAVVGGGLVGTALAYELVGRGVDVVLVDRHHPGRATDAGAGILSPETTWNPDPGWFSFGMNAATHYRSLISQLTDDGGQEIGFAECGLLLVAMEPGEDEWFATRATLARARSPGLLTALTPGEACSLFPPLGPPRQVLHNPRAARVDGRSMNEALLRVAERRGLQRLEATATGLRLSRGRVVGLDSDAGVVSCGAVAIAGGAWSSTFADQLGVPISVQPVKGQIVHMRLPDPGRSGVADSGDWPIVSPVLNHYLVPWPDGRVACGGTYEADGRFDCRPTVAGVEELLRACLAIAPGLGRATVVEVRVGLRPVSADSLPVLGPVPGWENVHLVTGHGTEGLLLGPYSAALVAGCLLGGPVDEQVRQFGVSRFMS